MALEALKAYAAQMQNAKEELQQPETEQASKALITHMERERQAAEYAKKQAEYIKLSERLRAKINKEVQQGADIYTILLDALQCIAVMTGDSVFYTQNIERLPELPRYQSYQSYHCYQGAVTGGNSGVLPTKCPKIAG